MARVVPSREHRAGRVVQRDLDLLVLVVDPQAARHLVPSGAGGLDDGPRARSCPGEFSTR